MLKSKWFYHPLAVFIFSLMALMASLFLYIRWYLKANQALENYIQKFNLHVDKLYEVETWSVILVLSILVAIICLGIITIYVYNHKNIQLYRMQRNFINNFTHELKTPLTSLRLFLDTFAKHNLSRNDQLKYINFMIKDIDRLTGNVNRIMNLAKIEGDNYNKNFTEDDICSVITNLINDNQQLFHNAKISIFKPDNKKTYYFLINIPLIEMLITNIIRNSMIYNDSTSAQININFKEINNYLHIEFSDNGIGILKNELKKVFKKFYQPGNSDDMTAKGSGLGLYLVQSIAKIHKAKVKATSDGIGKGTTISLMFPLKKLILKNEIKS